MKKTLEQISIATILGWGLALVLAAGGSYAANFAANRNQIEGLKSENTEVVQRIATLEEAITTLKNDNKEIKQDIKSILQILR